MTYCFPLFPIKMVLQLSRVVFFDVILQLRNMHLNPWSPVWLKYLDQNNLAKAQLPKIKQNRKNLVS